MKNTAKNFMFYVAFVASLGGLLFGFDTAVISGAEKSIQVVYDLSDFSHGFTIAIALIGTIIGAFVCSKPVEKHGRLKALKIIAFLYFVSAVGSAAIIDWYSFLFFRFAGGLAVGASSIVGPMYIGPTTDEAPKYPPRVGAAVLSHSSSLILYWVLYWLTFPTIGFTALRMIGNGC